MNDYLSIAKKSGQDFLTDDCMSSGAAIAYYTIFSLPPLLAIVLMFTTWFGYTEGQVNQLLKTELGLPIAERTSEEDGSQQAESTSQPSRSANAPSLQFGNLGILSKIGGILILLFSATGVFGQLQYSLNKAWEVEPDPRQGGVWAFISKRLLSAGMIAVIGFLLLVSLVLTTFIDEILKWVWGADGAGQVLGIVVNELVSAAVVTVLFAALFKFLPDAKTQWRDVWVGSIGTALLFVIGKALISWYLEYADVGSDWGTSASSVIGVLVWVYYSSLIVLFGAEFTQAWASEFGHGIEPAEGAVRTVETQHLVSNRKTSQIEAHCEGTR